MKKTWVKKSDKHTRYKISHTFKYNPRLKQRSNHGKYFYVYEHADKLVFLNVSYYQSEKKRTFTVMSGAGVLKWKNGRFNFYYRTGDNWKNVSNQARPVENILNLAAKKIQLKRVKRIIKKFAAKYNRKFIGRNIPSEIIKLCYPVLEKLAPENENIKWVNPKYTRYLRGKLTSRFVKSLVLKEENQKSFARYFDWVYETERTGSAPPPTAWKIKYIKLDETRTAYPIKDLPPSRFRSKHDKDYFWSEQECDNNVIKGKFREIPASHGVLMEMMD